MTQSHEAALKECVAALERSSNALCRLIEQRADPTGEALHAINQNDNAMYRAKSALSSEGEANG